MAGSRALIRRAPRVRALGRRRARPAALSARGAALWLTAIVALGAAYLLFWSLPIGTHQPDEQQYVWLARWIAQDPWPTVFNFSQFVRGLQRLEVWALSVPLALGPAPGALLAGRVINALAFSGTAVPVFLLARRLGIGRAPALVTATLALAVPWSVVGTAFLTENFAYPATAWAVLAFQGLVDRPGDRAGALALLAILVAGLARTSLLFLALVPLAVVAAEGATSAGRAGLLRRHRVVLAGIGAALLAAVVARTGFASQFREFSGATVYQHPGSDPLELIPRCGFFLSRLAAGTGFLPLGLAVGWGADALLRRDDPRGRGFAIVAAVTAIAVLVPVAAFTIGVPDVFPERYLVPLAALPFVGAALALLRRPRPRPVALVGGTAAVAALVAVAHWNDPLGPFDSFVRPAQRFVALEIGSGGRFAVAAGAVVAAVALVATARSPRTREHWPRLVLALTVAVGAYQAATVQSNLRAFADGPGARHGPSPSARAWVDAAIYGRGRALLFGSGLGNSFDFHQSWADVEFWNTSVDGTVSTTVPGALSTPPGDEALTVSVDERTGAIGDAARFPRYLVLHDVSQMGLRAKLVAHSSYLPLRLVRLVGPPTALWRVTNIGLDGWTSAGEDSQLDLYTSAAGRGCLHIVLEPPPGARRPVHYEVLAPHRSPRAGTLVAGRATALSLPLDRPALRRDSQTVVLRADGAAALPDGRSVGMHVAVAGPAACPRPPATRRAT